MAAARRVKRVAATQEGFLNLSPALDGSEPYKRRKKVNKNKKKNWLKYSDIQDVEEFLDDVRLQERATGGLVAEKADDSLFFLDTGDKQKDVKPDTGKTRPLKADLILRPDSHIPPPKDVLSHQQPNAKKLRRISQKAEQLAAKGRLPRKQRLLQKRLGAESKKEEKPGHSCPPQKGFYDLWGDTGAPTEEPWYLEQTKKKPVKRPARLNVKPSALPAIEVVSAGASYNPDFESHQALLLQAHVVEVKRQKEEQHIDRQLAVPQEDKATEETVFQEVVEGLMEDEEEEEAESAGEEEEDNAGTSALSAAGEKKTEKQRKKEKLEREKEKQRKAQREQTERRQQLFRLRSIKTELQRGAQLTAERQERRRAQKERQKFQPRRLGRLKFEAPDLEVQLSTEISSCLRRLKPEGSVLKDRFKSFQKRNLIEPRERAKFKRKHKLKYVEKRAFKEITL
ncbi:ribosome biogenesis protein NOP53 [Lepisosteus oculatus]|uniref:ribosome biogenesis protein NOP53 n=1 Tax=Lepisosteus oculatus TaxID=7918 RepID=UPI00372454B0